MAIFHSYVDLPEGKCLTASFTGCHHALLLDSGVGPSSLRCCGLNHLGFEAKLLSTDQHWVLDYIDYIIFFPGAKKVKQEQKWW